MARFAFLGALTKETPQGESLMNSFASRLKDIAGIKVNGKSAFSKRSLA